MTDHRLTLQQFLQTDRYRLEAALEEKEWSADVAERLTDHLRYAAQVQHVLLEGQDPRDDSLLARLAQIRPEDMAAAIEALIDRTEHLARAIQAVSDQQLQATVLDPHQRGLTVLGHLYDFCRSNAMLVEWARGLPVADRPNPDFEAGDQ